MKTIYHYKLFVSIFNEVCLFCCYLYDYGTSKLEGNNHTVTILQSEKNVHEYPFLCNSHVWCNSIQSRCFSTCFLTDARDMTIKSQVFIKFHT